MGLILDASIFIEAERGTFDLAGFLASAGDEPVAIAAITASELLHGVERATDNAARSRRHDFVESIVADFPVVTFGLAEARAYARIWAALSEKGTPIGPHDLLVAATAVANEASVATLNQKEFRRVPGLTLATVGSFTKAKRGKN
jgi:tRNA(fMet)-specific endonuclease VapC